MAKWIKIKDTYFNAGQIRRIDSKNGIVKIDGAIIADFNSDEKAEQFIKDFIDEHYVKTEKVQ